jgi:Protein of unknown function (DUF3501)
MIAAMNKLTRDDLYSLEKYAQARPEFRKRVLEHKKARQVPIGPNATLYFEDALTVQYQIQEMLRVERIFEAEGIEDELGAYNPLIPDGSNWKATFMVEFPDVEERKLELARLIGIEDRIWVQVSGHDRVFAIADEDLDRENAEKTSSVHFVRFELAPAMVASVKSGAAISIGIDHENYRYAVEPVQPAVRDSLAADLA